MSVIEDKIKEKIGQHFQQDFQVLKTIGSKALETRQKWDSLKDEYIKLKSDLPEMHKHHLANLKVKIELTKQEYKIAYREWQHRTKVLFRVSAMAPSL